MIDDAVTTTEGHTGKRDDAVTTTDGDTGRREDAVFKSTIDGDTDRGDDAVKQEEDDTPSPMEILGEEMMQYTKAPKETLIEEMQ